MSLLCFAVMLCQVFPCKMHLKLSLPYRRFFIMQDSAELCIFLPDRPSAKQLKTCCVQDNNVQKEDIKEEEKNATPALADPVKSEQEQPAPKKRKKAAAIKEERFDSPKIDMKGRYFVS